MDVDLATLSLLEQLIARRSLTPHDAGCQALMAGRLQALGFHCETLEWGPAQGRVTNLWAVRAGAEPGPTLAFAGHTDVVPTGPLEHWRSDPFVPTHRDGQLYGRGAADMKASLAAMVVAVEEFVAAHPRHRGRIAFLITSDEEGPSVDGTKKVEPVTAVETSRMRSWKPGGSPTNMRSSMRSITQSRRE